jgi:hypothetical protein
MLSSVLRLACAICVPVLVSSPAFAQPQPPSPPAPPKTAGHAAVESLIGNTMTGTAGNAPYFAFYDKGGMLKMERGGEISTGQWSSDGDDLCEEFPDDDDETCYKLELDGSTGIMTDMDGTAYKIEILAGNPRKL